MCTVILCIFFIAGNIFMWLLTFFSRKTEQYLTMSDGNFLTVLGYLYYCGISSKLWKKKFLCIINV